MNYDIIEFPEEGDPKSSNQREFPSLKSGRGQMVSPQEQETLQLRALKLQKSIKATFALFTITLRMLGLPQRELYCLILMFGDRAATVTFCGETSFSFGCFFFHAKLVKAREWLAVMWQGASLCIIEICLQSRGGSQTLHRNKSNAITPNRVPFLISRRMRLVQSGLNFHSFSLNFPLY